VAGDRHQPRQVNIALTCNALLAIIPFDGKRTPPARIAEFQNDKTSAISLILHAKPIP
jgi:hypothetical protein